jgi:hypothetical protein
MNKILFTSFFLLQMAVSIAQSPKPTNQPNTPQGGEECNGLVIIEPKDTWLCPGSNSVKFITSAWNLTYLRWERSIDSGATWLNFSTNNTFDGGLRSDTVVVDSITAVTIGYQYRAVWGSTGCSTYYTPAVSIVKFADNTALWTGYANDFDWRTSGNWCCGIVPTETTDVIIDYFRQINLNVNATIRSLSIKRAAFNMKSGVTLTILH